MSNNADPAGRGSFWSGYELLWGLQEPATSRRTTIDRHQIVTEAIEIADREGLGSVTMRSVAAALGTGAMSLYRHVPDKDALVSLMVDAAIGGPPDDLSEDALPEGWRARLRLVAERTWELCQRHRWFPEASMTRPPITPSGIRGFELALSFFDDFELDIGTKAHFVSTVYTTVVHTALNAIIEQDARARAALTEAEMFEAGRPFVMEVITSGRFPRVSAFIVEAQHLDETARMRAAIELIIDGIAARLDALIAPHRHVGTNL
jgi:AcrR family transcriptional regulator